MMLEEAMQIGLGRLFYSPDVFWAMSLKEFRAAQRGLCGSPGAWTVRKFMTRARLKELMALYPDRKQG